MSSKNIQNQYVPNLIPTAAELLFEASDAMKFKTLILLFCRMPVNGST